MQWHRCQLWLKLPRASGSVSRPRMRSIRCSARKFKSFNWWPWQNEGICSVCHTHCSWQFHHFVFKWCKRSSYIIRLVELFTVQERWNNKKDCDILEGCSSRAGCPILTAVRIDSSRAQKLQRWNRSSRTEKEAELNNENHIFTDYIFTINTASISACPFVCLSLCRVCLNVCPPS